MDVDLSIVKELRQKTGAGIMAVKKALDESGGNSDKAEEILKMRDDAFIEYHTYEPFLEKIKNKFGTKAVKNINDMTKVRLKRMILGD